MAETEIFPKSNNPQKWIDWMFWVFLGIFTIMTIRGWSTWFVFSMYIFTTLALLAALYYRKKLAFFPLMILSAGLIICEFVLFFDAYDDGFTFKALFSSLFIIFVIAFLAYVTFCNYMMWKYYPEILDYNDEPRQPMMTSE